MPIGQTTFQKGASLSAKCRIVAQAGLFQQKQRLPAYHKDKYKHKYKGNDKDKGKYNDKNKGKDNDKNKGKDNDKDKGKDNAMMSAKWGIVARAGSFG